MWRSRQALGRWSPWLLVLALSLTACGHAPKAQPSSSPSVEKSFDGTISGWRIAPSAVIDKENLGRHLDLSCTPRQVDAKVKTALDFTLGYIPVEVRGEVGTTKWICDGTALSVDEVLNPGSNAVLDVERALWGPYRAMAYDVPASRVEPCTILGHPAVCMHPEDDASGRGDSYIFVIENDTMSPFATVLRIHASEVPFSEVMKVANEIR